MINSYYDDKAGEDTLVVDIHQKWIVAVRDYSEWVAEDPEDYNYRDAKYELFKKKYSQSGVPLNNNKIFLASLKQDGKNLYRNIIRTALK